MSIKFDEIINRKGTESTKWDRLRLYYQDETLLPLWLADMDFATSDAIVQALQMRAKHPIYGYSDRGKQYYQLFAERFSKRHFYDIDAEEVVLSTGVMYSITAAIHLFTKPQDKILVFRPCYHPFLDAIENTGRFSVFSDMKEDHGKYVMNMEEIECLASQCKAILLCNPHNPTGRVFTKEELEKLADICKRNQLLIIVDEIHNDFIYPQHHFYPILNLNEYTKEHTISCVAPTKSFNLAGIKISAVFIKNKEMLSRFKKYAAIIGISSINIFAMEAVKAAYEKSQDWQNQLLEYLNKNRETVERFIKKNETSVFGYKPEGTYFYWLHFKGKSTIYEDLIVKAHVALSKGSDFHPSANEYVRLNFACPNAVLVEALNRIELLIKKGE